jgi:hypothetical protein
MSILAEIEKAFKDIFGSNKWEQTASVTLTFVGPLLTTIISLTAGEPAAAMVSNVLAKVQTGLQTASKVLADVASGNATSATAVATLSTTLTTVQTDLQSLLKAGQIKNPTTVASVTGVVNTIIGELQAILAVLPTDVTPVTLAPTAA